MCGRTPRAQPNAAMMPAPEPRDRPAAMEYTAPVPGVATTTRVVSKKAMLIGQASTFKALIEDTLLAVLGTLAERDAAAPKAVALRDAISERTGLGRRSRAAGGTIHSATASDTSRPPRTGMAHPL